MDRINLTINIGLLVGVAVIASLILTARTHGGFIDFVIGLVLYLALFLLMQVLLAGANKLIDAWYDHKYGKHQ